MEAAPPAGAALDAATLVAEILVAQKRSGVPALPPAPYARARSTEGSVGGRSGADDLLGGAERTLIFAGADGRNQGWNPGPPAAVGAGMNVDYLRAERDHLAEQRRAKVELGVLISAMASEAMGEMHRLSNYCREQRDGERGGEASAERKRALIDYARLQKNVFQRLLALVSWKRQLVGEAEGEAVVHEFYQRELQVLSVASEIENFMDEGLEKVRLPLYDVNSAISMLSSGSYDVLPDWIERHAGAGAHGVEVLDIEGGEAVPPELAIALDALLRKRLLEAFAQVAPAERPSLGVAGGMATVRVEGEVELQLTLRGTTNAWELVDLALLLRASGGEEPETVASLGAQQQKDLMRYLQAGLYKHEDAEGRLLRPRVPLPQVVARVRSFCHSLALRMLWVQAFGLRRGRMGESLRVSGLQPSKEKATAFECEYWSGLKLRVEHSGGALQCTHEPPLQLRAGGWASGALDSRELDMYTILLRAMQRRAAWSLRQLEGQLQAAALDGVVLACAQQQDDFDYLRLRQEGLQQGAAVELHFRARHSDGALQVLAAAGLSAADGGSVAGLTQAGWDGVAAALPTALGELRILAAQQTVAASARSVGLRIVPASAASKRASSEQISIFADLDCNAPPPRRGTDDPEELVYQLGIHPSQGGDVAALRLSVEIFSPADDAAAPFGESMTPLKRLRSERLVVESQPGAEQPKRRALTGAEEAPLAMAALLRRSLPAARQWVQADRLLWQLRSAGATAQVLPALQDGRTQIDFSPTTARWWTAPLAWRRSGEEGEETLAGPVSLLVGGGAEWQCTLRFSRPIPKFVRAAQLAPQESPGVEAHLCAIERLSGDESGVVLSYSGLPRDAARRVLADMQGLVRLLQLVDSMQGQVDYQPHSDDGDDEADEDDDPRDVFDIAEADVDLASISLQVSGADDATPTFVRLAVDCGGSNWNGALRASVQPAPPVEQLRYMAPLFFQDPGYSLGIPSDETCGVPAVPKSVDGGGFGGLVALGLFLAAEFHTLRAITQAVDARPAEEHVSFVWKTHRSIRVLAAMPSPGSGQIDGNRLAVGVSVADDGALRLENTQAAGQVPAAASANRPRPLPLFRELVAGLCEQFGGAADSGIAPDIEPAQATEAMGAVIRHMLLAAKFWFVIYSVKHASCAGLEVDNEIAEVGGQQGTWRIKQRGAGVFAWGVQLLVSSRDKHSAGTASREVISTLALVTLPSAATQLEASEAQKLQGWFDAEIAAPSLPYRELMQTVRSFLSLLAVPLGVQKDLLRVISSEGGVQSTLMSRVVLKNKDVGQAILANSEGLIHAKMVLFVMSMQPMDSAGALDLTMPKLVVPLRYTWANREQLQDKTMDWGTAQQAFDILPTAKTSTVSRSDIAPACNFALTPFYTVIQPRWAQLVGSDRRFTCAPTPRATGDTRSECQRVVEFSLQGFKKLLAAQKKKP